MSDTKPAAPIAQESVDFDALRSKADLFQGQPGLGAEIKLLAHGRVRIKQYTPPHFAIVEREFTETVVIGTEEVTETEVERVQVGTRTEERTRKVVVGHTSETYTETFPVHEDREVEHTRQIPIYELQTVARTRQVRVFKPHDVGGNGVSGEYVWREEESETEEQVIVGYETETYTVVEQVQIGEVTGQGTRKVPRYGTETYIEVVPVYEEREVEITREVPVYKRRTVTREVQEFFPPTHVDTTFIDLNEDAGTIFIDGRVTKLSGDLRGRLTIVGNEKVRLTGSIRYFDGDGETAMLHGDDYTQPYERNPDYDGDSVLGVIARGDVLFTRDMPQQAELNATLMSADGRIGIDGFRINAEGEPDKGYLAGLSKEEQECERAYNLTCYETRRFRRESLRRMGGLISNDRILETYMRTHHGTSTVDSGFKRGTIRFDVNLLFNPPPSFAEILRPVTHYAPVFARDSAT